MSDKILDRLISAFVGAVSAVGTVWFLNANAPDASVSPASGDAPVKFERLEVDELRINKFLSVADPETKKTTIHLSDGSISAQNNVFAEYVGAFRVLGRKIQATPDDPLDARSSVFAELATNQDGGAYLELLSPRETHSLVIGFDGAEKGCLISQNNEDMSTVAQAVFQKPTADSNAAPPNVESPAPADALPPFDAQDAALPNVESPAPADALPPFDAQDAAPLPSPEAATLPAPAPGV